MHKSLLEILVDPVSKSPLQLQARQCNANGEVIEGALCSAEGRTYPITNGIPRFVLTEEPAQRQTERSFAYKWQRADIHDPPEVELRAQSWLVERYGFGNVQQMREYFSRRARILDAGCGSGYSTSKWMDQNWRRSSGAEWVGADISSAVDLAQKRLGAAPGNHFVQADVLQLPFREESFDTIFSEGVLHHTPSTEQAFKALIPLLRRGGEIMVYIYRKKGPIREFTDDYIRGLVSPLPPEQAWELLAPLTKLAQRLAELKTEVEVPEDIPFLGIRAGRYDVQRLIYWHFAKLYWDPDRSFERNNEVNFDWYHPRYAHRHTEEELRKWCADSGLSIIHFNIQESGFTVRAVKN
jgi:arsenite methyltransferase